MTNIKRDRQATVGQQLANRWPTDGRQTANSIFRELFFTFTDLPDMFLTKTTQAEFIGIKAKQSKIIDRVQVNKMHKVQFYAES